MYSYDRSGRVATDHLIVSPQSIVRRALGGGLLTPEEAHSHKVQEAAQWAAENISAGWPEGEGFGTSDMTFVIEDMLNMAGLPCEFKNHRLVRKTTTPKEAAGLDMDLAKTYADAWSSSLIGKLAPKFITPAKLGDTLQPRWFDLAGATLRSLQWRSSKWMKPAEWTQQMKSICPDYNGFSAGKVGSWLAHFDVEVQPARESSVCVYLKGAPEAISTIENMAKRSIHADEVGIQDDGTLRLWWD